MVMALKLRTLIQHITASIMPFLIIIMYSIHTNYICTYIYIYIYIYMYIYIYIYSIY